jgi:hypothetical protein
VPGTPGPSGGPGPSGTPGGPPPREQAGGPPREPGGRPRFEAPDGRSRFDNPDGRPHFEAPDGRAHFEAPDGRARFENQDGRPRFEAPDGRPRFDNPDGRQRFEAPDGRERPGTPPEPSGPVIRQRDTAVPEERPIGSQPVASIAPDGLEEFARDLRALRAKAKVEYPEMAETSHFEMKTLAAAAGGLRLPTLPVAVAFVRACDGNVAEWEERWQKLASKLTAEAAKKRRNDGEDAAEPVEPTDAPAAVEPPPVKAAPTPPPDADGGEVYVITSAKPRPEPGGW